MKLGLEGFVITDLKTGATYEAKEGETSITINVDDLETWSCSSFEGSIESVVKNPSVLVEWEKMMDGTFYQVITKRLSKYFKHISLPYDLYNRMCSGLDKLEKVMEEAE
jgi:hypothetical protein